MFYIYRFLDIIGNVIYVGKSKLTLEQRFRTHLHLPKECYELVYKIEYIECSTESDMNIKEIYYINKYKDNNQYFNILDLTKIPTTVEFDDKWEMYVGPLPDSFYNSINYIERYTTEKVVRYNKDGTVDKRKTNKVKGKSSYVEGLSREEVDLIVDYLIKDINEAENYNQEQIRFRNLLMFIMGINLPIKANEFLSLRFKDVFDENNYPKPFRMQLGRFHKDKIIDIPLKKIVKKVLMAYANYCGISYDENADNLLFQSRVGQKNVSEISWGRILKTVANNIGSEKNIGAESIRKTYGLNIYDSAEDKLEALLFLGEIWGQVREAKIIKYLNLSSDEVDFNYYFSEKFSIGNVDLSKIECLKTNIRPIFDMYKREKCSDEQRNISR